MPSISLLFFSKIVQQQITERQYWAFSVASFWSGSLQSNGPYHQLVGRGPCGIRCKQQWLGRERRRSKNHWSVYSKNYEVTKIRNNSPNIPWFYSIQGILRPWNRSLEIELTASSCGIFVDHPTWDLGGQLSKAFRKSDRVKSEKIWLRSRFLFWIWISRLGWIHLPWINRATFAWNNEINSIELVYYTRTRIFDPDISR